MPFPLLASVLCKTVEGLFTLNFWTILSIYTILSSTVLERATKHFIVQCRDMLSMWQIKNLKLKKYILNVQESNMQQILLLVNINLFSAKKKKEKDYPQMLRDNMSIFNVIMDTSLEETCLLFLSCVSKQVTCIHQRTCFLCWHIVA